jgi:galacturonosyltransferase
MIIYHGRIPDVTVVHKISSCTILPSFYPEGMNNVLLESCSLGRPIITTDRPGCREIVDDGINGYLVPVKDSQALADAMMKYLALADDEKKKFSLASRKHAEKYFDVNDVIRIYDEIVHDAIK